MATSGSDERLLVTTVDAPWLPPGSSAEVWVGEHCEPVEPAILVRLLLSRQADGRHELFCVRTSRGPDLPTRFLGSGDDRAPWYDGLTLLAEEVLGRSDVPVRCIGYVRNVVPLHAEDYPHPTPSAYVPVFVPVEPATPVVAGAWMSPARGREELAARHWWPIAEHHLALLASGPR